MELYNHCEKHPDMSHCITMSLMEVSRTDNNTQFVTNYGTTCTVHVFEALTIPYCIGIQDSLNYLACVGLEPSSAWKAEVKVSRGGGGTDYAVSDHNVHDIPLFSLFIHN